MDRDSERRPADAPRAGLLVETPGLDWQPAQAISGLLRASCAAVPFRDRAAEREDLLAWCQRRQGLSVRLLVGEAGSGKTRLLVEACAQLAARGWRAGFLALLSAQEQENGWPDTLPAAGSLLIVIDDANERTRVIYQLLARLLRSEAADREVRVVLLARQRGEWWSLLCACEEGVGELLRGPRTEVLAAEALMLPPAARGLFFADATEAFLARLGSPEPPAAPPDLDRPHFATVLFVQIAALAAARGRTIQGADELLDFILGHDQENSWRPHLPAGLPVPAFAQAAALATLAGNIGSEEAARAVISRGRRLRDLPAETVGQLASNLRALYPPAPAGSGRVWLSGVQPALVGEHLVARALAASAGLLAAAFDDATEGQARQSLTVLCRLAQRRPGEGRWLAQSLARRLDRLAVPALQVAIETGEPAGQALTALIEAHPDPKLAEALLPRIPWECHGLQDLAANLCRQLLKEVPAGGSAEPAEIARRAALLNVLAKRLSDIGRDRGALAAAAEAVSLLGKAAMAQPDAHRPDLAAALSNYAVLLHAHGRTDHAVVSAEAAADVYRGLAGAQPDEFAPKLAACLETAARILSAVARKEDAVAALSEAVQLYRGLATRQPGIGEAPLALTLNTLAGSLRSVGRRAEALAVTTEAAQVLRRLAAGRPEVFRPKLGLCLNNLAIDLRTCGRQPEAMAVAEEAVALHRDLTGVQRDACAEGYARSLATLGRCHEGGGRPGAALAMFREAISVLAPRFLLQPEAVQALMAALTGDYRRLCAITGEMPDPALLRPVEDRLSPVEASADLAGADGG